MSAVIVSLADARARREALLWAPADQLDSEIDNFIHDVFRIRAIDQAERQVALELAGHTATRISIAQAHVQRSIRAGVATQEAIRRALAWARCSLDPFIA